MQRLLKRCGLYRVRCRTIKRALIFFAILVFGIFCFGGINYDFEVSLRRKYTETDYQDGLPRKEILPRYPVINFTSKGLEDKNRSHQLFLSNAKKNQITERTTPLRRWNMLLEGNKTPKRHKKISAGTSQSELMKTKKGNELVGQKKQITLGTSYLRQWNKSHPIVFMHIGKTGGTSFDHVMKPIIVQNLGGRYIGNRHFDWSYIDKLNNPDVLVMLRDPVARAVSHFYFHKRLRWVKKDITNITVFLRNPQFLMHKRDVWQDGQAAVLWLTGTHILGWIGIEPNQVSEREIRFMNHRVMCIKSADRLRSTLWFGLLSDLDRSLEMLRWQLGYPEKIQLSKRNMTPHPDVSPRDVEILKSLMPMDLWLYDYAKMLFESRWTQYKTGIYVEPEMPPLPEINCKSSRNILACNSKSPLGPVYYIKNTTDENARQQMELLPRHDWT